MTGAPSAGSTEPTSTLPANPGNVLDSGQAQQSLNTAYRSTSFIGDQFMEAISAGMSPESTADRLGVSQKRVQKWTARLAAIATELRMVRGKRPRQLWNRSIATEITLLHSPNQTHASAGETVTFTTWILNDSNEPLYEISLVPRSFTNANLDVLTYTTQPRVPERRFRNMAPGASIQRTFTYQVTERDAFDHGDLISAMGVYATTKDGRGLWDESDAEVILTPRSLCM